MQVKCTALFGPQVEEIFLLIQRARRKVEVSAEMLLQNPRPEVQRADLIDDWNSFRADVWPAYGKIAKGGDEVSRMLTEFKDKMEALCRPVIDRQYAKPARRWGQRIASAVRRIGHALIPARRR